MEDNTSYEIDRLLLKIALQDDENAFRILFLEYFSSLCVFAHRYIESWGACEDVVQDTFFNIWKNRKSLDISDSGRNYLITCVRNRCVDYLRKKDSEALWQQKEIMNDILSPTEDFYSARELEEMLNNSLSRLPENIRLVFEQNRFEGKTYAEIAAEMQISVKTVEAYMTKALRQLRTDLKDFLPLFSLFL